MRYRDAGVDIARADALKQSIGSQVRSTWTRAVHPMASGFAGVMSWPDGGPLLAATLDGVGTKLHLAIEAGRVADATADLVYHCANDLLAHGARPLALLDYIAQERLDSGVVEAAIEGLCRGCREVGAALLGGETAEMPDTYRAGVLEVAGCMIGTVSPAGLIDGRAVRPGDSLLGLGSTGLHTNGYSLARRVIAEAGVSLDQPLPGGQGRTIGEALLEPHRWYGRALLPMLDAGRVHALAHVTGGGIGGNLVRVLGGGHRARVHAAAWPRPALFRWILELGRVPEEDARQTLNLGIGIVVVCAPADSAALAADLEQAGERVFRIGEVVEGERGVEWLEGP